MLTLSLPLFNISSPLFLAMDFVSFRELLFVMVIKVVALLSHPESLWLDFLHCDSPTHKGYISFSLPLRPHPQFSVAWTASSHYVLSNLNLTCTLSFAGRNTPSPHPRRPKHQNTGRGQGSEDTATTTFIERPRNNDGAALLLYKHIFYFLRKMLPTSPLKWHAFCLKLVPITARLKWDWSKIAATVA